MPTATDNDTTTTIDIRKEIVIAASPEIAFETILEELGPGSVMPDGKPFPMKIEPWPGGRWYRDLGEDNGHLWGFVQSIKRPGLLEIWGPLFMSSGATSHLIYRLSETPEGSLIKFTHTVVGPFPDDYRSGLTMGWTALLARVRKAAESAAR